MNDNDYINIAVIEALNGKIEGEIPVGVVIVKNNKILYQGYNKKEQLKCSTKHAEIIAIEEVSKKINDWRLSDCEMYVTMEPCLMCIGALIQSRIKKLYYLVNNSKFGGIKNINLKEYNHEFEIIKIDNSNLENKYKQILRDFFEEKR